MGVEVTFLGAAGTVTGSKYLVRFGDIRLLIDCGMFQGERRWREENWRDPVVDLASISAVLLTHAHIDHIGLLPRYQRLGLNAPVYCTKATAELTTLLLLDSARLQEEEAAYRLQEGRSRHHPPLPLYTVADVNQLLPHLSAVAVHRRIEVLPGVFAEWRRMGHILGAASIRLEIGGRVIIFSGDIGRYSVPILKDPEPVEFGDLLLIESTYGDRLHSTENPAAALADIISETEARGGVVVIPSFAVGRAQLLLYYMRQLKETNRIPDIPVIIDSPMADDATRLYRQNTEDYDEEGLQIVRSGRQPFHLSKLGFTQGRSESIRLNSITQPMVIISASGMLSGGRILHHLKHRISDSRNSVVFVGHQPEGGKGASIVHGAPVIHLFGDEVPVRAHIHSLSGLSAHGDRDEMLRWCRDSRGTPGQVAIVHGEPASARAFQKTLETDLGWKATVPEYLSTLSLS